MTLTSSWIYFNCVPATALGILGLIALWHNALLTLDSSRKATRFFGHIFSRRDLIIIAYAAIGVGLLLVLLPVIAATNPALRIQPHTSLLDWLFAIVFGGLSLVMLVLSTREFQAAVANSGQSNKLVRSFRIGAFAALCLLLILASIFALSGLHPWTIGFWIILLITTPIAVPMFVIAKIGAYYRIGLTKSLENIVRPMANRHFPRRAKD